MKVGISIFDSEDRDEIVRTLDVYAAAEGLFSLVSIR